MPFRNPSVESYTFPTQLAFMQSSLSDHHELVNEARNWNPDFESYDC